MKEHVRIGTVLVTRHSLGLHGHFSPEIRNRSREETRLIEQMSEPDTKPGMYILKLTLPDGVRFVVQDSLGSKISTLKPGTQIVGLELGQAVVGKTRKGNKIFLCNIAKSKAKQYIEIFNAGFNEKIEHITDCLETAVRFAATVQVAVV